MADERAPIMRVTRLGWKCEECGAGAVWAVTRSVPDPQYPRTRMQHCARYCTRHLPPDARLYVERQLISKGAIK